VSPPASLDEAYEAAVTRLRSECLGWPGVIESLSWGNPTFKAHRTTFAVVDIYRGLPCIWIRCGAERRAELLGKSGYFPAPYDKKKLAVCRELDGLDWAGFHPILLECYEAAMTL
jgi:hypothetical protein